MGAAGERSQGLAKVPDCSKEGQLGRHTDVNASSLSDVIARLPVSSPTLMTISTFAF